MAGIKCTVIWISVTRQSNFSSNRLPCNMNCKYNNMTHENYSEMTRVLISAEPILYTSLHNIRILLGESKKKQQKL